jgi:hypothetical protein
MVLPATNALMIASMHEQLKIKKKIARIKREDFKNAGEITSLVEP